MMLINFKQKGKVIPTIFGVWKQPKQIPLIRVDKGVLPHLLNGADLMAPGIIIILIHNYQLSIMYNYHSN
jgi:predicted RNA-binding protein (TIGR00451 family)